MTYILEKSYINRVNKMSRKNKEEWISLKTSGKNFKDFKPKRHSYKDEEGQHWLQCKFCYDYVKVDNPGGYITCSSCVIKLDLINFPETAIGKQTKPKTGRPPGWHFMNEYVDKNGNVFHKGKEQPELKGTLKPTKVKPKKKKKKLSEDEKLQRDLKNWKKRKKLRRGK